jgi:hypothetical protein
MDNGGTLETDAITALRKLQQFHLRRAEELERALLRIRSMPYSDAGAKEVETKYRGCDRKPH